MSGRKARERLAAMNLLEMRPVRLANWEEVGERVVIERPEPTTTGLRRLLDQVTHLMSTRRIRLDRIGSQAWRCLDGDTTVADAAARLRETFADEIEPAEERLGHLVRLLHSQRLVGYPEFDDPRDLAAAPTASRLQRGEASG